MIAMDSSFLSMFLRAPFLHQGSGSVSDSKHSLQYKVGSLLLSSAVKESFDFSAHGDLLLKLDWEEQLKLFQATFTPLVEFFLQSLQATHTLTPAILQRIKYMLEYNLSGGKYNRALLVTNSLKFLLAKVQHATPATSSSTAAASVSASAPANSSSSSSAFDFSALCLTELALVLGWCVEILQAMFLVADDMMDRSITRRGKPCWYKLEEIQFDAINDTLVLESFIWFSLHHFFAAHPLHIRLVQLFSDVSLSTQLGQMLDLHSQPQGKKGADILKNFSLELYTKIVVYKTSLYSFYLPIAAALLLVNQADSHTLKIAQELCMELGTKFQIQDDVLDCYGDPAHIGKIGTDIRDHKCSWLCVKALEIGGADTRKFLEEKYGSEEHENEVKAHYIKLKLKDIFDQYEEDSFQRINDLAKKHQQILPPEITLSILKKIHKRTK